MKRDGEMAFDAVYRHYYRGLCVFCSQYVGELEEAEEIVQDTMLWLWENRSTLMEDLNFKTLMFTIVKNKALNRLSHIEVKRKVLQEIVEKYETEFEDPDIYLTEELLRLYKDAVNKLPPEFKEAYELTRNLQLTHREIAERLNVSPQTVNYRIGLEVAANSPERLPAFGLILYSFRREMNVNGVKNEKSRFFYWIKWKFCVLYIYQ